MTGSEDQDNKVVVAASAPKIPLLDTESVESWLLRAEAKFRTSNVSVSRTKVDYALDAIPRDIIRKCQLSSVYSSEDPWKTLSERLKATLGQDPLAVISRMFTGEYDSSSCLSRLADMTEALESVSDLKKSWLQFGILRLVPESDHEALLATHGSKSIYDFASEADLLRSRRSHSIGVSGSLNALASSTKGKKKPTLCFYHRKFGKKAVKCERYSECPPLIASVEDSTINNVLLSGDLSSSDEQ